jgi:hypothetical protein
MWDCGEIDRSKIGGGMPCTVLCVRAAGFFVQRGISAPFVVAVFGLEIEHVHRGLFKLILGLAQNQIP